MIYERDASDERGEGYADGGGGKDAIDLCSQKYSIIHSLAHSCFLLYSRLKGEGGWEKFKLCLATLDPAAHLCASQVVRVAGEENEKETDKFQDT